MAEPIYTGATGDYGYRGTGAYGEPMSDPPGGDAVRKGLLVDYTLQSTASTDSDSALFEALSRKHPDYLRWERHWRVYRDVVDDSHFRKEDYLPRNEREFPDQYRFRVSISEFLPDTPSFIERIVAALYEEKPQRELSQPGLVEFAKRVTRGRNKAVCSMDAFMKRAASMLMTYGTNRVLVTSVSIPGDDVTRADEQAAGARPYLVLYSPLAVIDWATDDDEELIMARVREEYCRKADPLDPLSPLVEYVRFIQYDRENAEWWVFAKVDEKDGGTKYVLDSASSGSAAHGLGMVPMVVAYWPHYKCPMIGCSYIRYMARAEISRFRNDSDLDYDAYMHAHPELVVKSNRADFNEVITGASRFTKLRSGDAQQPAEDMFYLEYPTPAHDALSDRIQSKRHAVKRYASVDPAGLFEPEDPATAPGVQPVSGVSRAWSFGTSEARVIASLGDAMSEQEAEIFDIVARVLGAQPTGTSDTAFTGEIQYPDDFDMGASAILLDEQATAGSTINSPTLIRYMQKQYAHKKASDADPATLKKIETEIDTRPVLAEAAREDLSNVLRMPRAGGVPRQGAASGGPPEAAPEPRRRARPRSAP